MTTIDCETCARQMRVIKTYHALVRERLSMGQNEARVLCAVPDAGEVACSELGRSSGVNGAMLSRAVGSLERNGLLATRCDGADRRRILVSKTEEGCEAAELMVACRPRRLPIARKTWRRLSSCVATCGISLNGFLVLLVLDAHANMSSCDIARRTGLAPSSVHYALAQLEQAALIRGKKAADNRHDAVRYSIAPDGRELIHLIKYQMNS